MSKNLATVLEVDKDKCVNCHACITACPVKYCNDALHDYVKVNANMCIACGNCIKACTHEARYLLDDMQRFLDAIAQRQPIVAIVAPAIASNFPNQYLNFNGWLKSIGVAANFDVSFGAELTVKSYLEHVKTNAPQAVIAQPCPALVTYIQIYQPELIPYLAPADSPMTHTMKMVRNFYPQFSKHKLLIVSPCGAKRREFDETGIGDFNVTFKSFSKHLKENNINLAMFPETDFDNPSAERAVLFSTPGGLMRTAERDAPGISNRTRKIEGTEIIYHYLQKLPEIIKRKQNPLLIDCLNCEMGCNGGPGTLNQKKSPDEVELYIERRNQQMQKKYQKSGFFAKKRAMAQIQKLLTKYWKPTLYKREYMNLSQNNTVKTPTSAERIRIFESMYKFSEQDVYNCSSCGYGKCEDMAKAIFNNLNKAENCHFYKNSFINKTLRETQEVKEQLEREHGHMNKTLQQTEEMKEMMEVRHEKNMKMALRLADHIRNADDKNTFITIKTEELLQSAQKQSADFKLIVHGIQRYSEMTQKFSKIIEVINITAEQINLLSLNASIESARAGEYGKRFAVVASEIKELANRSRSEGAKISPYIEDIKTEFSKIKNLVQKALNEYDYTDKLIAEVTVATQEMSKTTSNLTHEAKILTEDDIKFPTH